MAGEPVWRDWRGERGAVEVAALVPGAEVRTKYSCRPGVRGLRLSALHEARRSCYLWASSRRSLLASALPATAACMCPRPGRSLRPRRSPALPAGLMPKSPSRSIGRFVGGAISDSRSRAHGATSAYARFRHPAVAPLTQLGRDRFVLELFHGPTLAFKDVAMQLLARLMDHALARRGARATIVGRDLGRYRRRRRRGVPWSRSVDLVVALSARPRLATCSGA